MTEKTTLGMPWPWVLKRHFIWGDRFFFFSVSPCTFVLGAELLMDGFVLLLGPMNIGWASISSFEKRDAQVDRSGEVGETTKIGSTEGESAVVADDAPTMGKSDQEGA